MVKDDAAQTTDVDEYAKLALQKSYQNCKEFPWIDERLKQGDLFIHVWFFDIKSGKIFRYSESNGRYAPLEV